MHPKPLSDERIVELLNESEDLKRLLAEDEDAARRRAETSKAERVGSSLGLLIVGPILGYIAGFLAYGAIGFSVNILDRLMRGDGIDFTTGAGRIAMLAFAFGGAAFGLLIAVVLSAVDLGKTAGSS